MRKSIIKTIFFLVFFLLSNSTFSQQRDYIIGKLLDAKTQEPIVYASIRIKGRALGIISNVDGSFKIPLKYKEYGDIIEISSMGYETKEILISKFILDKINIVQLNARFLELQEAVVSANRKKNSLPAKRIVRKAIDAISRNYPNEPFSIVGYYRDYQLKDAKYVNLNEAILDVFDLGFQQFDHATTKVKIYDYKKNKDFERNEEAANDYNYESKRKIINNAYLHNYGGNEFTILRVHDALRNYKINSYDFINKIAIGLFDNHNFYKEADTYTEKEELYTIKIMRTDANYRIYGRFYISKKDYAIHKMEYAFYDNTRWNANREKNKHGNKRHLIFEVTTEYRRKYNKMYLNYISFQNSFQIKLPPRFAVDSVVVNAPKGYYLVCFNKPVDIVSASHLSNYKFFYKNKKIAVERLTVFNDSVRVYPQLSTKQLSNSVQEINEINRKGIEITAELFDVRVKKVKDVNGNVLNKKEVGDFRQFREFFVQQVNLNSKAQVDDLFMDKRKPIYKDQLIVKPDNFDDYWMNTPLQSTKN